MYLSLMLACSGCQRSGTIVSPVVSCFLFGRPGTLLRQTHTSCPYRSHFLLHPALLPCWAVNQDSESFICAMCNSSAGTQDSENVFVTLIMVQIIYPNKPRSHDDVTRDKSWLRRAISSYLTVSEGLMSSCSWSQNEPIQSSFTVLTIVRNTHILGIKNDLNYYSKLLFFNCIH